MRDVSTDRQPREPWGRLSCKASTTQRQKCCSLRAAPEGSDLQHLLSTPTLQRGERSTSQARPQTSPRANSQCQLLPSEDNTPQKCTGTPLLRGGCQTCPLSPPTPPPPLHLAWGALTCHAASLGQGGLLPTCREESRRVTDSFHFQHSFKAQTSLTQDQIHAESMVLSERSMTDPRQAVLLHRAKDSSCLPRGAQGTLSSQSAGAGPREKQSPCRPVK